MKKYFHLFRVKHWIKNLFVFVPLIFSRHLVDAAYFKTAALAFLAFALTSSMVYVFNDIFDVENDRKHPHKKERPIASGEISPTLAWMVFFILLTAITSFSFQFNSEFRYVLLSYGILNILYSTILKKIVIVDVLCVASGFMLRVLGGAFVINVNVSSWLILTTLFVSLFLAIMKRKSESQLIQNSDETRSVLLDYTNEFINQIAAISAAGVIICYALYTMADRTINYFGTEQLVFTSIFVIFGVFRYMFLTYNKRKGENAIEDIITDKPMIINAFLYIASVILIIY
ncbi:MAG: decaprenyl-phosphate phosphoribosyltransferase [Bacteroidetes bacterium]|nr:decaprenyl-phosphate phosphoribosyltransferase [Bacteroidota bacterium]MBU1678894.1 decaprenyl-phosphate phosphoribosyltransferase [Bacteroidota bacterium]MBU2506000.1 decaprenyl-phosphate phosphoribosyltransferase [Bacteroidota bacterium]